MEDPDEPENSTNRAEKESEIKMEEEEEQIGGNDTETNEEEEDDDDDDDFGDFEEAPSKVECVEGTSAAENNPRRETQARISAPSLPPIFSMTIRRLLEEPTIWQCTSAEAEMNFSNQTRPPPFDLFPRLDAGLAANDEIPQIPDEFMLKAHLLWTQLCYLEEAMALKFKWDAPSLTYQRLVWAIDLQQKSKNRKQPIGRRKQQRRKDEEKSNQDQETAPNVATVREEQPSTSNGLNQSDQSNIQNDSLVVPLPPTDFDSNFFLENQSTAITNGIDPIDLASFGIASTAIECEEKNNGTNHVNSLSVLDAGKLAKISIDGQKKLAAMSQLDGGNPQFG